SRPPGWHLRPPAFDPPRLAACPLRAFPTADHRWPGSRPGPRKHELALNWVGRCRLAAAADCPLASVRTWRFPPGFATLDCPGLHRPPRPSLPESSGLLRTAAVWRRLNRRYRRDCLTRSGLVVRRRSWLPCRRLDPCPRLCQTAALCHRRPAREFRPGSIVPTGHRHLAPGPWDCPRYYETSPAPALPARESCSLADRPCCPEAGRPLNLDRPDSDSTVAPADSALADFRPALGAPFSDRPAGYADSSVWPRPSADLRVAVEP